MPQQTTVNVSAGDWVEITAGDVTQLTFQNIGTNHVLIMGTVGAVAPTSPSGALRYNPGQGERLGALTDLFPGVSGANRVFAYAESPGSITVSHA